MDSRQNHNVRMYFAKSLQYIKELFHWRKEKSKWNWPELHLYCGVCELKTGLYVRSFISMFIHIINLIINVAILYILVQCGIKFSSLDISDIEEYFGVNFSDAEIYRVKEIYTVLFSYIMFWVLFRFVYVVGVFLTIYAVYKKKPKILKFVISVGSFNWFLCLIISILGIMLLEMITRVLVIVSTLYEGYNLMALNSEYKKLRGKSKLLINQSYTDGDAEAVNASSHQESIQPEVTEQGISDNHKHCDTCKCYDELNQPVTTLVEDVSNQTSSDLNQVLDLELETEKVLNIKDTEVIFNQDLLVPSQSAVLEVAQCVNDTLVGSSGQRVACPRTLQLPLYPEKKIDIVDIPTIYDENQLHVSGSPVIEQQTIPRVMA